jgi:hypothetical protein
MTRRGCEKPTDGVFSGNMVCAAPAAGHGWKRARREEKDRSAVVGDASVMLLAGAVSQARLAVHAGMFAIRPSASGL